MKPSVFEFEDYRKFLRETYRAMKQAKKAFSFRYFAREAGFSSGSFFKLVMDGKRNLSQDGIRKFAKGFKFSRPEAEFFESLVFFNQAKTVEEKAHYFERMVRNRRFREVRSLAKEQYAYYSKWYYPAIREMVHLADFRETPRWIAERLTPKITEKQAGQAIAVLLKLGLLRRDEEGRLRSAEASVSTGPEVQSLVVARYHQEMSKIAADAVGSIPKEERDMSSLTLTLSEAQLPAIKDIVARFRRELLACEDLGRTDLNRVYQLNIQVFPVTENERKKK